MPKATPAISLVVVLYDKALGESVTLSSMLRLPFAVRNQMEVVIRDNTPVSRVSVGRLEKAGFAGTLFDHDGMNRPLGEVYLSFAQRARAPVLFFYDDDSEVSAGYLEEATRLLRYGADPGLAAVCVPRTYDATGRLFSPARYRVFRGEHFASIEPGSYQGLTAIMSGLATTSDHLRRLGPVAFSTKVPLYGVDTMFMCANAQAGGATIVASARLTHSLSRDKPREFRDQLRRTCLEAAGIWWTVVKYRRKWIWALPAYIGYFVVRQCVRGVSMRWRCNACP